LVVGAGALGNEIIKNLALLGVGHLLVADLDRVENSNLSRSVLFRESDNGTSKATVAARRAQELYPAMNVHAFLGDVIYDLGIGVFAWADLVIAGLDNREARLAINRACWKLNRPWIDGAIEQIQGCARVFVPDGPCYECTMSARDWELLQRRRSCNLLTRTQMQEGRTPTTPTISSIIAGVQCQEAVKLLHGLPTIAGRGWTFNGHSADGYLIEYQRKEDCYSHETLDELVDVEAGVDELTVRSLYEMVRKRLGADASVETAREIVHKLVCPRCQSSTEVFCGPNRVRPSDSECQDCRSDDSPPVRREVVTAFRLDEHWAERTLRQVGIPPFDVLLARSPRAFVGFRLCGDAPEVLGTLALPEEGVEWT
jgi:adenylyltransferase/sulfurtransferase